jgi:hypothetical protein
MEIHSLNVWHAAALPFSTQAAEQWRDASKLVGVADKLEGCA